MTLRRKRHIDQQQKILLLLNQNFLTAFVNLAHLLLLQSLPHLLLVDDVLFPILQKMGPFLNRKKGILQEDSVHLVKTPVLNRDSDLMLTFVSCFQGHCLWHGQNSLFDIIVTGLYVDIKPTSELPFVRSSSERLRFLFFSKYL